MSQVLTKFWLSEVTRTTYYSGGETKEATRVKLVAVKGEPFGPATPQGNFDALIVNPDAAKVFNEASIGQEFSLLITPTG